jgi:hypothetical protein
MSLAKLIALAVAATALIGCHASEVSSKDVDNWAQAHDANGNPVADQPSQDGR